MRKKLTDKDLIGFEARALISASESRDKKMKTFLVVTTFNPTITMFHVEVRGVGVEKFQSFYEARERYNEL